MSTATRKITVKTTTVSSRPSSPRPPSPGASSAVSTTFRPKARVNSSATVIRKTPSTASNTAATPAATTPRAASPSKVVRVQNGTLSPTFQPRVAAANVSGKAYVRPQTPVSAPGTPETRPRSMVVNSDVGKSPLRSREGSQSQLHHAMSFSSLQTTSKPSTSPSLRIRSKVSNISRSNNDSTSPILPSNQPAQARLRSPSSSSTIAPTTNGTQQQFYPITTASPAANPHRYGQPRPTAPVSLYTPIHMNGSPSTDTQAQSNRPRINGVAKVNFDSILPSSAPSSPPVSALSFSSRSSVSVSSTSTHSPDNPSLVGQRRRESGATELFNPGSPHHKRHGSIDSIDFPSEDTPPSPEGDHKVRAEAKSNRKIADLEISNRSLLTINSSLEATKNRQAKEIRDLRRKLRESRLALPPVAYSQAKSSWGPEEEEQGDGDSEDDSELEDATQGNGDEIYKRVKLMIESMLVSGRAALEKKMEDFVEGSAKVLTAEEVQSWHRSNELTDDNEGHSDQESISQDDISFTSSVNEDGDSSSDIDELSSNHDIFSNTGPPIRISVAQ